MGVYGTIERMQIRASEEEIQGFFTRLDRETEYFPGFHIAFGHHDLLLRFPDEETKERYRAFLALICTERGGEPDGTITLLHGEIGDYLNISGGSGSDSCWEYKGEDSFIRYVGWQGRMLAYHTPGCRQYTVMSGPFDGYNPYCGPFHWEFHNFSASHGYALVHSGAVGLNGEGVLISSLGGCGKSTISKVISGLYHPWSGQVLFDGVPMENIPNSVLHASIATVSQNISLFSGTVRDNLTMWNAAIPEENVIAAAKDACIHDFIMQQPGGYDYKLTEGASNLSGGQRQRIEIARALAGNPSILIMDEATSALDPIVEKQIMDNLGRRGCTCIIVAHRLSAIRDCTEIVVMYRGNIIQRGTHDSLKSEDGFYKNFIQDI